MRGGAPLPQSVKSTRASPTAIRCSRCLIGMYNVLAVLTVTQARFMLANGLKSPSVSKIICGYMFETLPLLWIRGTMFAMCEFLTQSIRHVCFLLTANQRGYPPLL